MKRIRKSFGYSIEGIRHAFQLEKNLQIFAGVYALVLLLGFVLRLLAWEWIALIIGGCTFMAVELMNTALERLTDVLDDQKKASGHTRYHAMMKATKDVGAAASLVSLTGLIAVVLIVFWPYVQLLASSR